MAYKEIPIPSGSSNVEAVAYDPETMDLRVSFLRGAAPYVFHQVPEVVATGFSTSGLSAGKYFLQSVKNQYTFN